MEKPQFFCVLMGIILEEGNFDDVGEKEDKCWSAVLE